MQTLIGILIGVLIGTTYVAWYAPLSLRDALPLLGFRYSGIVEEHDTERQSIVISVPTESATTTNGRYLSRYVYDNDTAWYTSDHIFSGDTVVARKQTRVRSGQLPKGALIFINEGEPSLPEKRANLILVLKKTTL